MALSKEQRTRALADAITFDAFVTRTANFTDEFRANYAATSLDEKDRNLLSQLTTTPIAILAIVEDWCPDVAANLPIISRIADETGVLRLHVLIRDDAHRDIADAYPYEGRSHIPTYVFFAPDGTELGVIVERPAPIRVIVARFLKEFFADHSELDQATFPAGLTDALRTELTSRGIQIRHEHRHLERSGLVEEIHSLATADHAHPVGV